MSSSKTVITQSAQVMGGTFAITALNSSAEDVADAFNFLKELEQKWTRFGSTSEIAQLNNAEGASVHVSDETVAVVQAMIRGHKITKGYFDPTTLPILVSSGYEISRKDPSQKTVLPASAKWPGDMSAIQIVSNNISLPVGTTLDAGGIGKGFAADLVVKRLMDSGASGVLVNANGDVVVDGESPQSGPWIIGVESPVNEAVELEQIRLVKGAVATSSKVHQTWSSAGKQVHHLVNPLTGSTAVTNVLSASVICASGADAEALAKVPFILDMDLAIKFIETAGAQTLLVDENLRVHKSSGWEMFS